MAGALIVLGLLTAVVAGLVSLFTGGEFAGGGVALLVIAAVVFGVWFATAVIRKVIFFGILALFIGALAYGGYSGSQVLTGLRTTEGAPEPPDPAALASAEAKLDTVQNQGGIRLELTEEELSAVVQDGLDANDTPVRSVRFDFVAGANGQPGVLRFETRFKSGALTAKGELGYRLDGGDLKPEIHNVSLGAFSVPRAVRSALDELVEEAGDLNATLREHRVTVQSLQITDGSMILIGTQGDGPVLSSAAVVDGFKSRFSQLGAAQGAPPERVGAGTVNALEAPGSPVYVALGDSLAANIGVAAAREGYVSRFHTAVQQRDGKQYGLRNFGISGETSGTIRRGQLDAATEYMRGVEVAYVTINIGANDILPHLGAEDCAGGTANPACKARIDASLEAYRTNLDLVLRRVKDAAPLAQVIFLQTYNPFSFGFAGLAFEDDTNRVIDQLNGIGSEIAKRHGLLVADGASPLKGRAAATTHMAAAVPDIHPQAIGYSALAGALLDAK